METKVPELYYSLVGSSIDFSFKKKLDNALSIENNIRMARARITKSLTKAIECRSTPFKVTCMAELLDYYRRQTYYMAVRGAIELRRLRPDVLSYLNENTPDERAETLYGWLESSKKHPDREVIVEALRYYLMSYPSRARQFREVLTREEYLIVV